MITLIVAIVIMLATVAGGLVGFKIGRERYLSVGIRIGQDAMRAALPAMPELPECVHGWGMWSKPKWTIKSGGYARVQRRTCRDCGEEQERFAG